MTLLHITAKNVKLHKFRTAVLLTGLSLGVAMVVGMFSVTEAMRENIQDKLDAYGANMVITPKSEDLSLNYAGVSIGSFSGEEGLLTEQDAAKIRTIKNARNINIVAPKLVGLVKAGRERAVVVGAKLREEFKMKKWWNILAGRRPAGENEVLIGGDLAKKRGWKVGSPVELEGKRFRVAGILARVGSQEDGLIFMDLKRAQELMGKPGDVNLIETSAWCKNCPIDEIARQTRQVIPNANVSAVRQAAKSRDAIVSRFFAFAAILSVAIAAVAGLVVFANVLTAARERRREIGIFRAVGYRKSHILAIILAETVLGGAVAGAIGWFVGFLAARFLGPLAAGLDVVPPLDLKLALAAVASTPLISAVASAYPAFVAANADPAEALRAV